MAEELAASGDRRASPKLANGFCGSNLAFATGFLFADKGLFLALGSVLTAVATGRAGVGRAAGGATSLMIFWKFFAIFSMSKDIEADHTCVDG